MPCRDSSEKGPRKVEIETPVCHNFIIILSQRLILSAECSVSRDTFLAQIVENRETRLFSLSGGLGDIFLKCMTKTKFAGPKVLLGAGDLLNLPAEQNKTKKLTYLYNIGFVIYF